MKIDIEVEVDMPKMPNFLRLSDTKDQTVDVGNLSSEAIEVFCEQWSDEFCMHCSKRKDAIKTVERAQTR